MAEKRKDFMDADKVEKKHREDVKNSIGRFLFVGIALLVQLGWVVLFLFRLTEHYLMVSLIVRVLTVLVVLRIFGKHENAAMKMSWILTIMAAPILGVVLYELRTRSNFIKTVSRRFNVIDRELQPYTVEDAEIQEKLRNLDRGAANQFYYLRSYANFPVYQNTDIRYYPEASEGLKAQIEEIRKAKHYIFMEYHAIEDKNAFLALKTALIEKAKEGVLVRIFYDDVGSVGFISPAFVRAMEAHGIECRVFNPIVPIVNLFMNNRDHRKITVIDGTVGFTGGYNLADEYFNITHPHGYWKDVGIRMEGEAVHTLTMLFLEMWNTMEKSDRDYAKYLPEIHYSPKEPDAFAAPYADSPLDEKRIGEDVYLNLIKNAKDYVYIMTPYLILTDDMSRELCLAARRGVDVRIITPGKPDKKLVLKITQSYFGSLASAGVRIYEYTPGFCHGKMAVSDDTMAVIGTINFDYRSLYHHFENAVLLYRYKAILDMKKDFENCFSESMEQTEKYRSGRSTALRIGHCLLRFIAPLV